MNEKEAREIIKCHYEYAKEAYEKYDVKIGLSNHVLRAEGYIEAIEKAKGLTDCLRRIQKQYQGYSGDIDPDIEKTLAQWEKIK